MIVVGDIQMVVNVDHYHYLKCLMKVYVFNPKKAMNGRRIEIDFDRLTFFLLFNVIRG